MKDIGDNIVLLRLSERDRAIIVHHISEGLYKLNENLTTMNENLTTMNQKMDELIQEVKDVRSDIEGTPKWRE